MIRALPAAAGRLIVTPGVRPAGAASGDQKRIATPARAIADGADHIVVGRPVWQAADPRALRLTLDAAETYERLGTPEGELALAQAVVYLAVAAKSNAVYKAWNEVRDFVRRDGTRPVPAHLRNAPTRLMKQLDYGRGYRYAHDEEGGFAAGESYWPEGMEPPSFYQPVDRGLEIRIAEKLEELRRLNDEAKNRR